jgi:spore coat protein CotH
MLRNRVHAVAAVCAFAGLSLAFPIAAQTQTPAKPTGISTTPLPVVPQPSDAFFDDTAVSEIRLAINSRDWQSLQVNYLDNTYYPCDFKWKDQTVRNIGIRSRGTGSRSGQKPGLRVDFDRYTTDQTFLGLKSFILRNQTQDASNIHERVSMMLFKRLGLAASREAHTKLYINNAYAGLYTLVESIDKTFLTETFNDPDGYLYKYDYPSDAAPYTFADRGSDAASYVPLPFKPETHETDPRPEFIVQLVQAINQSSDAVFRTAMAELLDLKRFVRHIAVENFVSDNDGFNGDWGMNNFYFYQFSNMKLFTFIAWDKSEAFKAGFEFGIFRNTTNKLTTRVLAQPDLYSYYLDTLLEVAASAAEPLAGSDDKTGWLEREIRREYLQIRDAALADPQKTFSGAEFEQAIADMGTFARHRGDSVTSQVGAARSR